MNSEADVKRRVKRVLKSLDAWWYMPVPQGYGKQGVPDFLVCLDGAFIAIETKFGGNKPTRYQQIQLDGIEAAGGVALVINEHNVEDLEAALCAFVDAAKGAPG